MSVVLRQGTLAVHVGGVQIGDNAPIVVQAMTNVSTEDVLSTRDQILQLAGAGAELIRISVDTEEAAGVVPDILHGIRDLGCTVPLVGDFHYNGHLLLSKFPGCAESLAKYRINPGNVGIGKTESGCFATICRIAADNGKAIRIGVNAGSVDKETIRRKMASNTSNKNEAQYLSGQIVRECMIESVLDSSDLALKCGLREDQIVLSCKTGVPSDLISLYRDLSQRTNFPLHLGLTEAGLGIKGLVWSSVAMGVLLQEGIGDTIRVSLTPRPNGDRREEVYAAWEMLQSLGIRARVPTITACPGCGRTSGSIYLELASETEEYVRNRVPEWQRQRSGVENLKIAVMGCIVNGPGESRAANVGLSLPGRNESPRCPVYVDGFLAMNLAGTREEIGVGFRKIIEEYVAAHYHLRMLPEETGHP